MRSLIKHTSLVFSMIFIAVGLAGSAHAAMVTLVTEGFGGSGSANLDGTSADTFDSAITTAGGSGTWVASTAFKANGFASTNRNAAYLNLGSYITSAKGTADGKFALTATISETTGTWLSLGFATENTPNIARDFTNPPFGGSNTTTGIATILYRDPNNELDMFVGTGSSGGVDGPNDNSGPRTLTVSLDFTPAVYNGSTTFGTVTWTDSALGNVNNLGTAYALPNVSFGSILLTGTQTTSSGTYSNLSLTQTVVAPEIAVSGNGNNIADGSTGTSASNHTDFGTVITGAPPEVRSYTISNVGSANLTISGTAVADSPTPFAISAVPGSPVAPGGSTALGVTMSTSTVGSFDKVVSFTNNDVDEGAYDFHVTGTVLDHAQPSIIGTGLTTGTTTDYVLDLGEVAPGGTAAAVLDIVNQMTSSYVAGLDLDGAVETQDLAGAFFNTRVGNPFSNLAADGSSTQPMNIQFDATGLLTGDYSALYTFTFSDVDGVPGSTSLGDITLLVTATVAAVPEPHSLAVWAILGLGLIAFGAYRMRRT